MKQLGLSKIATVGTLALLIIVCGIIYLSNKIDSQKKETYNKEEQKEHGIIYKKGHTVMCKVAHPYVKYDSIVIREQYIEGCRWGISINGVGTHVLIHTISNCPKCREFFVSLSREP